MEEKDAGRGIGAGTGTLGLWIGKWQRQQLNLNVTCTKQIHANSMNEGAAVGVDKQTIILLVTLFQH